jgi:hypothetical protein
MLTPEKTQDAAVLCQALAEALDCELNPEAIDWTNVKKIIAALLTTIAPMIVQWLIELITTEPPVPPAKPKA